MKKTMIIAAALLFTTLSSQSFAASIKCKITAVDDSSISLDCGAKANKFKVGDEVKVRAVKKEKAIEGC